MINTNKKPEDSGDDKHSYPDFVDDLPIQDASQKDYKSGQNQPDLEDPTTAADKEIHVHVSLSIQPTSVGYFVMGILVCLLGGELMRTRLFEPVEPVDAHGKAPNAKNLSIVSWNILAPEWRDFPTFEGVDQKILSIESRRPRIIATMEKANADIFCLQEVQRSEYDIMADTLKDRYTGFFGKHGRDLWKEWTAEGDTYEDHGNAFFVRKGHFDEFAVKFSVLELSHDGNSAAIMQIDDMVIVNTHMSHPTDKSICNLQQIQVVEDFIEKIEAKTTVYLGDLNSGFGDLKSGVDLIERMRGRYGYTDLGAKYHVKNETCTSVAVNGCVLIDYIMIRGRDIKDKAFRALSDVCSGNETGGLNPRKIEQALAAVGSDHLPIYAELEFATK